MHPAGDLSSLRQRCLETAQALGAMSIPQRVTFHAALVLVFALACSVPELQAQSAKPSPGRNPSPPFSSSLPHVPLPAGEFAGWCGKDDAFLMWNPDTQYRLHHKDGHEVATIALDKDHWGTNARCDESGENVLFTDKTLEGVFAFNLKTKGITTLLSVTKVPTTGSIISLAPNLRYLAYDETTIRPGQWATSREVKALQVKGGPIRWKSDSSMLFTSHATPWTWTPQSNIKDYRTTVDVIGAETGALVSGQLPPGYFIWDGRFASSGEELLLNLKLLPDDQGYGTFFRCRVATSPFRCRAIAPAGGAPPDVEDFSTNGREVALARVIYDRPVPKSWRGISPPAPDRYFVQIFDSNSKPLRVAQFARPRTHNVKAKISPSGLFVAVIWHHDLCRTQADFPRCKRGVIFTLNDRR